MFGKKGTSAKTVCFELKARTSEPYVVVDIITPLKGYFDVCRDSFVSIETVVSTYGIRTFIKLRPPAGRELECVKIARAILTTLLPNNVKCEEVQCQKF